MALTDVWTLTPLAGWIISVAISVLLLIVVVIGLVIEKIIKDRKKSNDDLVPESIRMKTTDI